MCTLGGFVSSCCPRLRKLYIGLPQGLPQLVIRSETLEELRLFLAELRTLDVAAPSLRVLKLELCFHDATSVVTIAAPMPRLEETALSYQAINGPPSLDIHDRASCKEHSPIRSLFVILVIV